MHFVHPEIRRKKQMRILIIGCSNGLGLHHLIRDTFVKKKDKFICLPSRQKDEIWRDKSDIYYNLSSGGAGNRYITNRLMEWINVNGNPDYVYLQYSGLNRIDLSCSKSTLIKDYVFQRQSEFGNWVHSGGMGGSWHTNGQTEKMFNYLYDPEDQTNVVIQNLFEINNAVNFLSAMHIPFNWNTYYDYKQPPNPIAESDGIIDATTEGLYDKLDKTKKIETSVVNHIASTNISWLHEDQIHYEYEGGMDWLSCVKDQFIIKDLYGNR
jgi:hypothetical protein